MGADELRMAGFLEREGVGKERVTVSRVWSVGRGRMGWGGMGFSEPAVVSRG